MKSRPAASSDVPARLFKGKEAWAAWLDEQHCRSSGIWLRLAKKASGVKSVSYSEALEVALCYGWIDGQKRSESENTWLQKFAPRTKQSIWSKINRQKALALIRSGRMNPAGLKEIERAKRDGRWAAAYDSPGTAVAPSDFQAALDRNPRAKAFFAALDARNRYAVFFRIHTAKKAETRTARIQRLITMLEEGEKLHP
jgi:uncharacterized protein YdeI (YjbR/CyaY-like superfamily)